jgi:hypothetical protein
MYRTPAAIPLSVMSHANGENNIESRKGKTVAAFSNSTIKEKVDSLFKKITPHTSRRAILGQFCYNIDDILVFIYLHEFASNSSALN